MRDDDILTVGQVAAQLHVTPQTVRAWIDGGKLRGGRVGKAYMILRGDVYAMIEQAARDSAPSPTLAHGSSDSGEMWSRAGQRSLLVPPGRA
jgi:excisionase family DNA binding protein